MSQKKVDQYKEQKANRKEIIKKEKRILLIEKIIGTVVVILAVVWVGFSIFNKVTEKPASEEGQVIETTFNTSALDDYLDALQSEDAE